MADPAALGLTPAQLAQYDRDGYLILPNFFSGAQADALKARADQLLADFDLATHPRTVFKTRLDGAQTQGQSQDPNKYFLDSADRVHFFFEEHAFNAEGELTVAKTQAINKIGHYLHERDPQYHDFTYRDEVKALAKSLEFKEPVVLQSMVICKQPRIGGVVDPHRDSTFLETRPSTATGLWFALEDCTNENGCLSFVPGSHRDSPVSTKRFKRKETDAAPLRAVVNNPDYSPAAAAASAGPNNEQIDLGFDGEDKHVHPPEAFIPAPVSKGTLVLINGDVVHASTHNHSAKSRYIYTFHIIDASGTTYPSTNWLQSATKFPRLQ